ncbi:hypothetical protein HOY80DRAFT_608630 [Tuber brumale]|nr:hypothetical protein HOY80DRAFT_608630 [Tuber brumale]
MRCSNYKYGGKMGYGTVLAGGQYSTSTHRIDLGTRRSLLHGSVETSQGPRNREYCWSKTIFPARSTEHYHTLPYLCAVVVALPVAPYSGIVSYYSRDNPSASINLDSLGLTGTGTHLPPRVNEIRLFDESTRSLRQRCPHHVEGLCALFSFFFFFCRYVGVGE